MKIIEPVVEIEKVDYNKMMKNLERACRTCYRSEDKITEESYKTLLKNCINRGHESILEHEKITIRMTCDIGVYKDLTRYNRFVGHFPALGRAAQNFWQGSRGLGPAA